MKLLTVAASLGVAHASLYPGQSNLNHTCQLREFTSQSSGNLSDNKPETPFLSCFTNAYPNITDSCCTETYGGLVVSTQFWSTYTGLESKGQVLPKNSWSLHGLWPDFCNGSYTQYCDLRSVPNPPTLSKNLTSEKVANTTRSPHQTPQRAHPPEHP